MRASLLEEGLNRFDIDVTANEEMAGSIKHLRGPARTSQIKAWRFSGKTLGGDFLRAYQYHVDVLLRFSGKIDEDRDATRLEQIRKKLRHTHQRRIQQSKALSALKGL